MRRISIPAGPFPDWARQHRTLAQVARTQELLALARSGQSATSETWLELTELLRKELRHNPPPDDPEAA